MSVRPLPFRRPAIALAVAAAALGVIPGSAAAVPPDDDGCAVALARAASWPGNVRTDTGTVRLVSDAYVSFLSASPACATSGT